MTAVRSRRWTVEVGPLQHCFWQEQQVECVWIDFWQRAGSSEIEVESVQLWSQPYGDEIAALNTLDVRDRVSGWLAALIAEHRPVLPPPGGSTAADEAVLETALESALGTLGTAVAQLVRQAYAYGRDGAFREEAVSGG